MEAFIWIAIAVLCSFLALRYVIQPQARYKRARRFFVGSLLHRDIPLKHIPSAPIEQLKREGLIEIDHSSGEPVVKASGYARMLASESSSPPEI